MTTHATDTTEPKTEMTNLIDAIINREDSLKLLRTEQGIARTKLKRLMKKYPELASDLSEGLADAKVSGKAEATADEE